MADITISDLELAPALADDMVLAVENTTDTYAATLAMLRRLINKTFVEVENADFNALTDDGFYQCTGTPTNSPVAGAINWTLQVSAERGVVVQRAFSLDDNFANLYIRRWNGVTWTGWLNIGKGALDNKANVSNTVTTDTNQTITGTKTFNGAVTAELESINFIAKNPNIDVQETPQSRKYVGYDFRDKNNVRLGYIGIGQGTDGTFQYEIQKLNNNVTVIYGITPPAASVGREIVTAGWFREAGCTARTVIETYVNGNNWYRVWSDGWIEQGGVVNAGGMVILTGNLLKPFSNTNYSILATGRSKSAVTNAVIAMPKTNDTFNYYWGTSALTIQWYACGY